jgi:voltage-gated potassium channel
MRNQYLNIRKRAFDLIEQRPKFGGWPFIVNVLIVTVIFVNIAAVILFSIDSYELAFEPLLMGIELFSVCFFTIEYVLRIWVSKEDPFFQRFRFPRLRYLASWSAVIDLLAVLPFYLIIFGLNIKFLLLLRFFRLLKIVRYFKVLQLIARVFRGKAQELSITVFSILTVSLFILCVMNYVEGPLQPEVFGNIPEAIWWAVITLTTVGYDNEVPVTILGKFLGGIIALLGIGIFALPAGILASGFSQEFNTLQCESPHHHYNSKDWPHCGKPLELSKINES